MVAIEKASEMFNSLGLEKFQAEGLLRLYAEYLDSNKRRNKDRLIFEVCPKCGSEDLDYLTRIIGYLKRISSFSEARQTEAGIRYYTAKDATPKEVE